MYYQSMNGEKDALEEAAVGMELNRWQRLELRLYEKLGMRGFRDLLFRYERFHHRKRGGYYPPYHLKKRSAAAARDFIPQLRSNAVRHGISIAMMAAFFAANAAAGRPWRLLELPGMLVCIGNLWCIGLQRYNYLRILRVTGIRNEKKERQETL